MMFSVQRDRINTLRVRSAGEVKSALRLAVKNEISQLQLQPTGMPPSAVLLVRHVLDPRLSKHNIDKHLNNKAWCQAVRDQLQEAYRRAVRPNGNGVSGDPQAVLFRDQAELIATLSVDIVASRVAGKWWWRSFSFRSSHVSSQLRDVLQEKMEMVPAVFAVLSRQGQAIDVVKSLDRDDAYHLTQAVLHQLGFQQLSSNLMAAPQQYSQADMPDKFDSNLADSEWAREGHKPQLNFRSDDPADSLERKHSSVKIHRPPPWAVLLGDKSWSAELSREQNALLGFSRMLHESAVMLRNSSFQRELVCWWRSASQSQDNNYNRSENPAREKFNCKLVFENISEIDNKVHEVSTEAVQRETNAVESMENATGGVDEHGTEQSYKGAREWSDVENHESGVVGHQLDTNNEKELNAVSDFNAAASGESEIGDHVFISDSDTIRSSNSTSVDEEDSASGGEVGGAQGHDSDELSIDELDEELDLRYSEVYIDTGLGGVLYIINLLKQLGIPEHFNESWLLDKQISYWAMTEIIARALLGKHFLKCDNDSIWRMLAKLDRRRKRFPIAPKYRCSADYVIPTQWFQYLLNGKEETFFWSAYRNRLRVWTKDIPLIDIRIDSGSDPQQVAVEHMSRLVGEKEAMQSLKIRQRPFREAPLDNRSQLLRLGFSKDLAVWLSLVLPAIRSYLQSALSLEGASSTLLLKTLFVLHARIYISACHIDLVADVNQTSLVLRRSGLDQDPNWQPEFGRVVLFHFQ